MAEFEYKAVGKDGTTSGDVLASTEMEAEKILGEQGLTVISLKIHRPLNIGILSGYFEKINQRLSERMSVSEKILFTNQLSSMMKAGLPLVEALSTFIDEKDNSQSVGIINKIIQDIQSGIKLSDSLAKFPKVFDTVYLAVVRSGESSGTLDDSLEYLGILMQREKELTGKVKSALIYPAVVMTAMVCVMIFISISIIPKILVFAESSGTKLPIYTLILVAVVSFFTHYWWLVILILVAIIISAVVFLKSEYGSRLIGKLSLKIPIMGLVVARYNQARFARILGGFYLYGVEVVTSFDILAATMSNPLYKDACFRIKKRLTLGQSLGEAVAFERQLFPSIMNRLIKGAEKTGDLGKTLDKLAKYYEDELSGVLSNLLALVEPVLVFVLGFGVLGLALAVILPIYRITSSIK